MVRVRDDGGTERLLGVRTNDADAARELRTRVGSWLAEDEPFAFPNVSLLFGTRHDGIRDAHGVYRRGIQVFHSFDRDAAIDAALRVLHTFRAGPPGTVTVQGRVLERDGAAVLVRAEFASAVDSFHRRLSRAGYCSVPYAPLLVDPVRAEVLVARGDDPCAPTFDRVPITHIVVQAPAIDTDTPASVRLVQLQTLVTEPRTQLRSADLRHLAVLVERVPVVRIEDWDARALVDVLLNL